MHVPLKYYHTYYFQLSELHPIVVSLSNLTLLFLIMSEQLVFPTCGVYLGLKLLAEELGSLSTSRCFLHTCGAVSH